ncbi:MAG: pyrroline-5-carboxylate reductase [Bacilli bacterium]|jgi:pyrroline-5-carboxylate reductase|nr:pyrroline-5-carboxylate reductase [Bacilli bacterium]
MKLGIIGTGNMATAIVEGVLKKHFLDNNDIYCYNIFPHEMTKFAHKFNINKCETNEELVAKSNYILLAVKPHHIKGVLEQIKPYLNDNKTIISIAAGVNMSDIEEVISKDIPLVRVMPNINAVVQEGAAGITWNKAVNQNQENIVLNLFNSIGKTYLIEEKDFPTYSAIAGCSPAFTYLFIDAIARAALKNGLNKEQAVKIAAQAVYGSAKMLLETEEHPFEMIDRVCSPGGTTIAGITSLENDAFTGKIMKAIQDSINRDYELQKK